MPLVMVDGDTGTYVLQCPDPSYANHWAESLKFFTSQPEFRGVDLDHADRPEWFDPLFWDELQDEFKRWKDANYELEPPVPPPLSATERKLLKAQAQLSATRADGRTTQRSLDEAKSSLAKLEAQPSTRKRGAKGNRKTIQGENCQEQVALLKKRIARETIALNDNRSKETLHLRELSDARKKLEYALKRRKAQKPPSSPPCPPSDSDSNSDSDSDPEHEQEVPTSNEPEPDSRSTSPSKRSDATIRSSSPVAATVPVPSSSRLVASAASPSRDLGRELVPARVQTPSSPLPEFGTQAGMADDFTDVVPIVASPDRSGDMEMSPVDQDPLESPEAHHSHLFGVMSTVLATSEFS
jgi:hypothetical protein